VASQCIALDGTVGTQQRGMCQKLFAYLRERAVYFNYKDQSRIVLGENSRLRKLFVAEKEEVKEEWRKLRSEVLYCSDQIIKDEMGCECGPN
jgi:predicted nucleotidyltransferase